MQYLLEISPKPTTVVYVSIGCFASETKDFYDNTEHSRNHEYPLFLRNMRKKYGKFNLHMFLIDPMLEMPPHICQNIPESELDYSWTTKDNVKFKNKEENITVYGLKSCAYHRGSEFISDNTSRDFFPFFDKLNELSMRYNWTTFVFNHSGEYFSTAPLYYHQELYSHCDHIIYGYFVSRNESSCGINTATPECNFITHMYNKKIYVFNPYYYMDNNKDFPAELEKMSHEDKKLALKQFDNTIICHKKKVIFDLLVALRNLNKNEEIKDYPKSVILQLFQKYKLNFDIKDKNNYDILFDKFFDILRECIYEYLYLRYFEDTTFIVEELLQQMMQEKDGYKWHSIIEKNLFSYIAIFEI